MEMAVGGKRSVVSDPNIVPLIDVLLVLLVLYMLMPHSGVPCANPAGVRRSRGGELWTRQTPYSCGTSSRERFPAPEPGTRAVGKPGFSVAGSFQGACRPHRIYLGRCVGRIRRGGPGHRYHAHRGNCSDWLVDATTGKRSLSTLRFALRRADVNIPAPGRPFGLGALQGWMPR